MKRWIFLFATIVFSACSSPIIGDRCDNNDSCPSGQYCARVAVCTLECTDGGTCPEGSQCTHVDLRDVCLRTCSTNDACNDTEVCKEGLCQIANPLDPP